MKAIVTGSGGRIGAACVKPLPEQSWEAVGIDNKMRRRLSGSQGSTHKVVEDLSEAFRSDPRGIRDLFDRERRFLSYTPESALPANFCMVSLYLAVLVTWRMLCRMLPIARKPGHTLRPG